MGQSKRAVLRLSGSVHTTFGRSAMSPDGTSSQCSKDTARQIRRRDMGRHLHLTCDVNLISDVKKNFQNFERIHLIGMGGILTM